MGVDRVRQGLLVAARAAGADRGQREQWRGAARAADRGDESSSWFHVRQGLRISCDRAARAADRDGESSGCFHVQQGIQGDEGRSEADRMQQGAALRGATTRKLR